MYDTRAEIQYVSETNQNRVVVVWNKFILVQSLSHHCNVPVVLTLKKFCRHFSKTSHSACSKLLNFPLESASSGPRAFDNNCTSYHIIHSPVVLEEQKCDEGREKEGNWKVFVQGSDSRSVGEARESDLITEMWDKTGLLFLHETHESQTHQKELLTQTGRH